MTVPGYEPVRVDAALDPGLSRWMWLVKWFLAIPHYVLLVFLYLGFVVVTVIAFFAILITGRYPRPLHDYSAGVLRWNWRVTYYVVAGTDRYPPFTLADVPDYPARFRVEYPERMSRGLVLVKWWLLALPHYLILGAISGSVVYASNANRSGEFESRTTGLGLLGLLVVFAFVALLFTGRYPPGIFGLVVGIYRWILRVQAYVALLTDRYPPFRLDQGGHDPASDDGPQPRVPPTTAAAMSRP
jgi:hypothetical protein